MKTSCTPDLRPLALPVLLVKANNLGPQESDAQAWRSVQFGDVPMLNRIEVLNGQADCPDDDDPNRQSSEIDPSPIKLFRKYFVKIALEKHMCIMS